MLHENVNILQDGEQNVFQREHDIASRFRSNTNIIRNRRYSGCADIESGQTGLKRTLTRFILSACTIRIEEICQLSYVTQPLTLYKAIKCSYPPRFPTLSHTPNEILIPYVPPLERTLHHSPYNPKNSRVTSSQTTITTTPLDTKIRSRRTKLESICRGSGDR